MASSEPEMTKEQLEEASWEFLPEITDHVAKLPNAVQNNVLKEGKRLHGAGVIYIHTIDKRTIMHDLQKGLPKEQSSSQKSLS